VRKIITILAILFALIFLGAILILFQNLHYVNELEYRISRYHTFGEISVVIDGQKMDINDTVVQFICDGNITETTSLNNNEFRIIKGVYGLNEYQFTLLFSDDKLNIDNLDIRIEHFNTNWWHVNDLFININISNEPFPTASMFGSINTRTKNGSLEFSFEYQEKEIDFQNNLLHIRTESP